MSKFSQAVVTLIHSSNSCQQDPTHIVQGWDLTIVFQQLTQMRNRPRQLTEAVYDWCSVVCENYSCLADGKCLLLLSLEIGFRHLNSRTSWIGAKFTHMNHQKMAEIVLESGDTEAIADLLHAWISQIRTPRPPTFLKMCAEYLINLCSIQPFPPRLQQLIIRSITFIGYQAFEEVGVEGLIELLNGLHAGVEEIKDTMDWGSLLLDILQSSNGIQHLSHEYWELLVELAISWSPFLDHCTYNPHTMVFLEAAEEWGKLECWMGVVWMVWSPEGGRTTEKDLEHVTLSLCCKKPGAIQKFKQWMEQWRKSHYWHTIPESFHQICAKAAQQDIL